MGGEEETKSLCPAACVCRVILLGSAAGGRGESWAITFKMMRA